eukprot:755-Heterococcus_DN1.PRE.2
MIRVPFSNTALLDASACIERICAVGPTDLTVQHLRTQVLSSDGTSSHQEDRLQLCILVTAYH